MTMVFPRSMTFLGFPFPCRLSGCVHRGDERGGAAQTGPSCRAAQCDYRFLHGPNTPVHRYRFNAFPVSRLRPLLDHSGHHVGEPLFRGLPLGRVSLGLIKKLLQPGVVPISKPPLIFCQFVAPLAFRIACIRRLF